MGLIANLLATDNEEFDPEITNKFILFTGKISVKAQQVYMHTSAAVSHMYHIQLPILRIFIPSIHSLATVYN